MTPSPADWGSDRFDSDLRALTDLQRANDAADQRRREHWLRQQSAEEGTFAGVLLDLGERDPVQRDRERLGERGLAQGEAVG